MIGSMPLFCTNKAALRLWPDAPRHGVFALLYWLEDAGKLNSDYDPARAFPPHRAGPDSYATARSDEHTSELQSLMRISYAVFCLKKTTIHHKKMTTTMHTL